MTDSEKIIALQKILSEPINWYIANLELSGRDYVYDESYTQFQDLKRVEC